mgnify:CR=1 FL=1
MEQIELVLLETEEKMKDLISSFKKELTNIRTGRANPALLDRVNVKYYGVDTPLKQISAISVVEGTQLYIKPFDKSILKDVEHAINASDLGISPQNDGEGVRLVLPALNEERRRELTKTVEKEAENAKVGIRNVRRDGNDEVKKLELPEDVEKSTLEDVQELTNKHTDLIDSMAKDKIKEIMTI